MRGARKMIFRRATPADATDLHALRRCSILELAPEGMPITLARQWAEKGSVESMSKRLQDTEVWVAELDDQIVGWIAVRGNDYLDALYVAPEHTKRGIGTDLLKLVEAELRARGVDAIRADASRNSEAFYIHRGYEPLGPRPADDARPMRKRLVGGAR